MPLKKIKPKTELKTSVKAKLTWLPKKTFELEFVIPWEKVKQAHNEVLLNEASKISLKGFRKGKAPLELVEKSFDKEKLYQKVLSRILAPAYEDAIKQHQLRPIISPKIQPLSLVEAKDWQFKAVACETPTVKLGNYQEAIKAELAKGTIWVPGKGKPDKKEPKPSYDEKLKTATRALKETVEVEIADILTEDELNRMLTRLLDQVNSLGMTIDQYLSSKNITQEQLRNNLRKQAEQTLKLEFVLQAIVLEQKIKISKEEVDKMIQATPDKKIQQKLDTEFQRSYIASLLAKRKALDYLTSL
ncbi:MAG TPA: trigger factor [Candidatus Bathyarchaeia archaeon]|nr:trigger factor [Candidatus Bathyarchaeia archaeon]